MRKKDKNILIKNQEDIMIKEKDYIKTISKQLCYSRYMGLLVVIVEVELGIIIQKIN